MWKDGRKDGERTTQTVSVPSLLFRFGSGPPSKFLFSGFVSSCQQTNDAGGKENLVGVKIKHYMNAAL